MMHEGNFSLQQACLYLDKSEKTKDEAMQMIMAQRATAAALVAIGETLANLQEIAEWTDANARKIEEERGYTL